jgi:hypothetical protein
MGELLAVIKRVASFRKGQASDKREAARREKAALNALKTQVE